MLGLGNSKLLREGAETHGVVIDVKRQMLAVTAAGPHTAAPTWLKAAGLDVYRSSPGAVHTGSCRAMRLFAGWAFDRLDLARWPRPRASLASQ